MTSHASLERALEHLSRYRIIPDGLSGGICGEAARKLCHWIWVACEESIAAQAGPDPSVQEQDEGVHDLRRFWKESQESASYLSSHGGALSEAQSLAMELLEKAEQLEAEGRTVAAQRLRGKMLQMEGAASVMNGVTQEDFLDALEHRNKSSRPASAKR